MQVGRAEQLPFRACTFDGILMALTLCFVADPELVFKECARIMRDDGQLIIGTIPTDGPWGEFYMKKKAKGHPAYSHAHFFTISETIHLAEKAGYKLLTSRSALFWELEKLSGCSKIEHGINTKAGFAGLLFKTRRGSG